MNVGIGSRGIFSDTIFEDSSFAYLTEFSIKEDMQTYTKHDLLFKQLIQTFFKEFLEAFFSDIHDQIDFRSLDFLPEEVFTDIVDGNTRRLDIVVRTKLRETDALIIVHIEPQSSRQTHFNERMFQYFNLLYNKYRLPIIPIALFSYDESWEKDQFTMDVFNIRVLEFRYLTLHLKKQNWRSFIHKDNPVVAALLSKMGYSEEERVQIKLEFLRMILRLEINPAEQRLLYGFFDTYLKLNEREEAQFMAEAKQFENADEILEIPISYEERGKEIGKEIGRIEAKKEVALGLLREGISTEIIRKTTKLDMSEIEMLREQL